MANRRPGRGPAAGDGTPRPRKRFGQNFLHDGRVIERLLGAIAPRPGQRLVEIGPGLGALTAVLLPRLGSMDVVELDRDLLPHLESACAGLGELRVHQADALTFDFCSLASGPGASGPGAERLRVVGNLPYNISTPLLFHLIDQLACIHDMHFMLQKEVVDRLAAEPGSGAYGRLSVMVQYHCRVEKLFGVGPGAFRPPPKVDSAVVRLVPHPSPPVTVDDPAALSRVVARAFGQRRKTLRNALKDTLDAAAIEAAGIDPGWRAERLTLTQFAALANALAAAPDPHG
ncbi:MAG TPA: 16S rRNA (adenine(1518)-N(6)/adenine(1519)-N(6))-dimethyltransferase RsmA [Gammaproteobacteria bacterium]|nr:16S rRNA (adenine(1518)-N(6)/adenine(1519)-N(6))-dimethyltransferase RsmA [Gammaproteobacteria bacterium]